MSTWPQLLVERQKFIDGGGGALPKIMEAYMNEGCGCQTHPRLNNMASTGIGPTWKIGCLIWFGLL